MWYWIGWVVTIVIAILIGARDWIKRQIKVSLKEGGSNDNS